MVVYAYVKYGLHGREKMKEMSLFELCASLITTKKGLTGMPVKRRLIGKYKNKIIRYLYAGGLRMIKLHQKDCGSIKEKG